MEELILQYPKLGLALGIVGSLCVIMTVIAPLTPSKKDDELIDSIQKSSIGKKIWDFLLRFSLLKK